MSAEIVRFVRIGSAPQLLRTRLRAHQRRLAALPGQTQGLYLAATRLPASLASDAILELLGDRLRQVLDEPAMSGSAGDPQLRRDAWGSVRPEAGSDPPRGFFA